MDLTFGLKIECKLEDWFLKTNKHQIFNAKKNVYSLHTHTHRYIYNQKEKKRKP